MKKKKKEGVHAKGRTGEKKNGEMNEREFRGRGKTERGAGETANKAFESRVYIGVNVRTSNERYVLITGT